MGWFIPSVVGAQASTAGFLQMWLVGRAFLYWCVRTKKIAFKLGIKGSLLQEHAVNPSGRWKGLGNATAWPLTWHREQVRGVRSVQGLTHCAISVTDVIQEQLHLSCICHILFPKPFPASATALTAMSAASSLGIEICPHEGCRHDSERMTVPGLGKLWLTKRERGIKALSIPK